MSSDHEQAGRERERLTKASAAQGAQRGRRKSGALRAIVEVVVIVAGAFVVAMMVQAFIVKPFTIHQVSMQPTLLEGDRILLNRLSYHFRDPEVGDIVVFHSPVTEGEDLVKRVVAVAGDRVQIRDGSLYVNGERRNEPYLIGQDFRGELGETPIPEGTVFVMGDNRDNSGDSRYFGPIDSESIIGCAFCVYWPIGRWRGL